MVLGSYALQRGWDPREVTDWSRPARAAQGLDRLGDVEQVLRTARRQDRETP